MPTVNKSTKQPMRSVKIDMAAELVDTVDRIAAAELLTRTAWLRRTINSATQYSRWREGLRKQEEQWKAEKKQR